MLITLRLHVDNYDLVGQVAEEKWKGLVGASMVMIVNLDSEPDDIAPDNAWPLHMANERTFLAWCRTGIALIVFSFVIERFDLLIRELRAISPQPERFAHLGKTQYVGVMIFVLGAAIMLLAGWRFFYMRRHINQGDLEFSTLPDIFLLVSVLVTLAMVFLLFVFLF